MQYPTICAKIEIPEIQLYKGKAMENTYAYKILIPIIAQAKGYFHCWKNNGEYISNRNSISNVIWYSILSIRQIILAIVNMRTARH